MELIGAIVIFCIVGMLLLVLLGAAMHAIFSVLELFVLLENVFTFLYKRFAPFRMLVNVLGFIPALIFGVLAWIVRIVAMPACMMIKMVKGHLDGITRDTSPR